LSKNLRIVGGEETDIQEFPYLVTLRLYDSNSLKCAGTIISDQNILTAAHCLYKKDEFLPKLRIYAGTSVLCGKCRSIYHINAIFSHPDFEGKFTGKNNYHNDIAVIKVSETYIT
jgi:secreted trypsin-like serine protease